MILEDGNPKFYTVHALYHDSLDPLGQCMLCDVASHVLPGLLASQDDVASFKDPVVLDTWMLSRCSMDLLGFECLLHAKARELPEWPAL